MNTQVVNYTSQTIDGAGARWCNVLYVDDVAAEMKCREADGS